MQHLAAIKREQERQAAEQRVANASELLDQPTLGYYRAQVGAAFAAARNALTLGRMRATEDEAFVLACRQAAEQRARDAGIEIER